MSPLLVVTPIALLVKHPDKVTLPTLKPAVDRKRVKLPRPVWLAPNWPVTLFSATHKSMFPAASTPRLSAVMTPAAVCDTPPADLSRTVPGAPALTGAFKSRLPASLQRMMFPAPLLTPMAPVKQMEAATVPIVYPTAFWKNTTPPAMAANVPDTLLGTVSRRTSTAAVTPRLVPMMAVAWDTEPAFEASRTVPGAPAFTGAFRFRL